MVLKLFQKCVEGDWVCMSYVVENPVLIPVLVAGKEKARK
jgi:hypothetical protein